jgi:pyridoxal phosphate enzyme (YggS family)
MHTIAQQLQLINTRIETTAQQCGRSANTISLLAVSKTQSPERVLAAYHAGQRAFGENYLQEARHKQNTLQAYDIEWHFIGPIQSNKTRDIAEHFDWVHSIDRLKVATRLSQQRPNHLPPLNICVQINIDNEHSKSGVSLNQLPELMQAINLLPRLRLRGLMVIPAKRNDTQQQHTVFAEVESTRKQLMKENTSLKLDTLSMGMSDDMEAAITSGSTMVRVGSAIFGARQ